ncbi:hypothetical protein BN2497_5949 [Janthinobacterium sp. CG23_2]|nr:hypothetical protein BN2497_5675 [Janthinobacterium sp. CG23_2]CUI05586.1 hypothetical protein BN2497_5949 [Janthinobacterium sp. CG23_2]CUU29235.1 hypothetical protein BN3177_5675 [Janthinobacterium sp. CG23_2]CUU29372.1 hypothetical protein BN3177_5949 [Janthinobacterium sp. CG23_2]
MLTPDPLLPLQKNNMNFPLKSNTYKIFKWNIFDDLKDKVGKK